MVKEYAGTTDASIWPIVGLIVFVAFFLGLLVWMFRPGKGEELERHKHIPLNESDAPTRSQEEDARGQ